MISISELNETWKAYFSECSSTGGVELLLAAEVEVVGVEDTAR